MFGNSAGFLTYYTKFAYAYIRSNFRTHTRGKLKSHFRGTRYSARDIDIVWVIVLIEFWKSKFPTHLPQIVRK